MTESRQRWLYSPRILPSADEVLLAAADNPKLATFRLMQAIQRVEWDVFEQLLPNVNVNDKDRFGFTPLLRAVQKNRPAYLDAILQREDVDICVVEKMNRTALHVACAARRIQALETLLVFARRHLSTADRLAWIDTQDNHGTTALSSAIQRGNMIIARKLLRAGASPMITNQKGQTSLYLACMRGDLDMVQILLGDNDPEFIPPSKRSELGVAITKNHPRVVDYILSQRPDIDLCRLHMGGDQQKWTYLQWAAYKNYPDVVAVLLNHGAPLWVLDDEDRSAFELPKVRIDTIRIMRGFVLDQFFDSFATSSLVAELDVPNEISRIVLFFMYH